MAIELSHNECCNMIEIVDGYWLKFSFNVWLELSPLSNMMDCPTLFWQRYLDLPGVVGNAASPAVPPPGLRHGVGNLICRQLA